MENYNYKSILVFIALFIALLTASCSKETPTDSREKAVSRPTTSSRPTTEHEKVTSSVPGDDSEAVRESVPLNGGRAKNGATPLPQPNGSITSSAKPPGERPPSPAYDRSPPNGHVEMAPLPDESLAMANGGHAENGGALIDVPRESMSGSTGSTTSNGDRYKVKLGADEVIKMPGPPGELRVWIGFPEHETDFRADMTTATEILPAVGQSARVAPFAPGFTVSPKESICMLIDPQGSQVRFTLTPIDTGEFNVGADVHLYHSTDCSGTAVPKGVATLTVKVEVAVDKVVKKHAGDMWKIVWEKFLDFWGAVLVLIFAALLFLLKGKIK